MTLIVADAGTGKPQFLQYSHGDHQHLSARETEIAAVELKNQDASRKGDLPKKVAARLWIETGGLMLSESRCQAPFRFAHVQHIP